MIEVHPPTELVQLRARAEAFLTCPGCGKEGFCRRTGGGASASRFQCYAYRYAPGESNVCRFVFMVTDVSLRRFK